VRGKDVGGLVFLEELFFLGGGLCLTVEGLLPFCLPQFEFDLVGEDVQLGNFLFGIALHQ